MLGPFPEGNVSVLPTGTPIYRVDWASFYRVDWTSLGPQTSVPSLSLQLQERASHVYNDRFLGTKLSQSFQVK
jgi:hypothetical protein